MARWTSGGQLLFTECFRTSQINVTYVGPPSNDDDTIPTTKPSAFATGPPLMPPHVSMATSMHAAGIRSPRPWGKAAVTRPEDTSGATPALPLGSPGSLWRNPKAHKRSPTNGNAICSGARLSGYSDFASEFKVQDTSEISDLILRSSPKALGPELATTSVASQARAPSGRKVMKTGGPPVFGNSSSTWVAVSSRPGPTITPLPMS